MCENHYGQNEKFIATCPHCGNDDTKKTIYLSEDSEMLKAYINGEVVPIQCMAKRVG